MSRNYGKFKLYVEYMHNVGSSLTVSIFDEDWLPAGPLIRRELRAAGIIEERDGKIEVLKDE